MAGAAPVQTQEDLVPPAPAAIGYRWAGVLLAPAAAAALHLVLAGPVGLDLRVPAGGGDPQPLGVLDTVLFSLGIGLVGWLVAALLERGVGAERGRRIWRTLAVAVFVLSLLPIALADIPTGVRWGLVALHAVVAGILIPALSDGTPAEHPVAGGWVEAQAAAAQEDTHASPATATGHDEAHEPAAHH